MHADNTWGAEVCRRLGAVCQTVAWSGRGMIHNYGGTYNMDMMPALWRRTLGSKPEGAIPGLNEWDFNQVRPDWKHAATLKKKKDFSSFIFQFPFVDDDLPRQISGELHY
jgi:hypothetical protein